MSGQQVPGENTASQTQPVASGASPYSSIFAMHVQAQNAQVAQGMQSVQMTQGVQGLQGTRGTQHGAQGTRAGVEAVGQAAVALGKLKFTSRAGTATSQVA